MENTSNEPSGALKPVTTAMMMYFHHCEIVPAPDNQNVPDWRLIRTLKRAVAYEQMQGKTASWSNIGEYGFIAQFHDRSSVWAMDNGKVKVQDPTPCR
jgi:hypothetical protein